MLVSLQDVGVSFGATPVLEGVTAEIQENSRIGLIGANGAGKSTLLNTICGIQEYESGEINRKSGLNIGYLKQNSGLSGENTIWEEMRLVFAPVLKAQEEMERLHGEMADCPPDSPEYKALSREYDRNLAFFEGNDGYLIDVKIKTILNGMGFEDRDVRTVISTLSGGEKTRLALAKLLLSQPELLILDEPTNHLDIQSREWIEEAVEEYEGNLLFVSHDRYFIDRFATRVWVLEDGQVTDFRGSYGEYRAARERKQAQAVPAPAAAPAEKKEKPRRPGGTKNLEKEVAASERAVAKAEEQMYELGLQIEEAASDYLKLQELYEQREALEEEILKLYGTWERLSAELEEARG